MSRVKRTTEGQPYTIRVTCRHCGGLTDEINGLGLRDRREAAGIGLRRMAAALGVSVPYLSDVERNRRRVTERVRLAYEAMDGWKREQPA